MFKPRWENTAADYHCNNPCNFWFDYHFNIVFIGSFLELMKAWILKWMSVLCLCASVWVCASWCVLVCAGVCMCEFAYPNPARSDTRLPRAAAVGGKKKMREEKETWLHNEYGNRGSYWGQPKGIRRRMSGAFHRGKQKVMTHFSIHHCDWHVTGAICQQILTGFSIYSPSLTIYERDDNWRASHDVIYSWWWGLLKSLGCFFSDRSDFIKARLSNRWCWPAALERDARQLPVSSYSSLFLPSGAGWN